jgi:hypothetical protein
LILPKVLKDRTSLHTNVDDKLLYPEIKAAQDMYIMPLLGSTLMSKMQSEIAANTLAGDYLFLHENYLIDCIVNYVLSELPEGLNYQFYNKGLSGKSADNSLTPTMSEMYSIVAKYKTRAEHYAKRVRMYLLQNADLFPEYTIFVEGVDTVVPDRTSYTGPIYLGDETEQPRNDYSLRHTHKYFPNRANDSDI